MARELAGVVDDREAVSGKRSSRKNREFAVSFLIFFSFFFCTSLSDAIFKYLRLISTA